MNTNDPMTQERLDEIRERLEVATDGPWAVDSDDPSYIIYSERGGWDGLVIAQVADQDGALFPVEHNGALIANAPRTSRTCSRRFVVSVLFRQGSERNDVPGGHRRRRPSPAPARARGGWSHTVGWWCLDVHCDPAVRR